MSSETLTIGIFLLTQTVAAVWWAASMSSTVKYLREVVDDLREMIKKTYGASDAIKEFGRVEGWISKLEDRVEKLEQKRSVNEYQ